jgi:zinc D-Ala-D-Ala carboxypeptidase
MYSTKNFDASEFVCSCCGSYGIKKEVVDKLQEIRTMADRPLTITSAYRCSNHPVEAKKSKPGTHNQGIAVDIHVNSGAERYELITLGLLLGAKGIGVAKTFIHLDWRDGDGVTWVY